jgi:RNA polymerase sigma factor (sigma-70 family)
MMTLEQIIDESFLGHITAQECIVKLRQRMQALTAEPGLTSEQFEAAYHEHADYIRRVLAGSPPDMIDDLAQTVWLRAWENRHQYRGHRASVKTWLSNIAKNVLVDHHRRNKAIPEQIPLPCGCNDDSQEDEAMTTPSEAPATNLRHDLAVILTPDDMRLLPLVESGVNGKEMASTLGITEKACETRVMRLRKRVQKYLAE